MASHPFSRPSVRYGDTPEPVTPYQRAAQVWDERLGSARVQARNWRLAALGATALSTVLGLTLSTVIGRSGVVPYVVEVDRLGEVRAVGPAFEAYQPSDAQIAHFLARFIENVRSLSIDPVIVRTGCTPMISSLIAAHKRSTYTPARRIPSPRSERRPPPPR
jgi:type IV secretory pathway TrbF-like protein